MCISNTLRKKNDNFIWPSFVDALASLLIVIIFILMVFVISQYYISQKLSGKNEALDQLKIKVLEITNQLSIEKDITNKLSLEMFNIQKKFIIINVIFVFKRIMPLCVWHTSRIKPHIN